MAKKNDSTSKKINSKIEAHDKQHTRNAVKRQKKVEKMFDDATKKASIIASATSGRKDSFELSKEPAARKRIDEVILQLNEDLSATIINGDKEEWLLSANKNDAIVDYLAQQTNLPTETLSQWKSRNLDALEAFQTRKIEGMNLSAKVWNITDQFKGELEMAIDVALGDGVSAAAMSRTVRKLLNNPTALFRRVRDKNGQLRLSQTAKNYHPGRGVYRSAYRNALRLTATETNMAYRTADHTRWQQLNFVTGIEIKLSANHNCRGIAKGQFYDICDELAGIYPKDFKFVSWHPFCRCFAIPKLADMDEFLKYQDKLVAGEDVSGYKFSGEVTQMPKQFNEWVKNNTSRLENAQSIPYFLKDNPKYSGITPRLGSTPTYAGTKLGRTATKQAYQEYKDATPPILTKEQQDNINDIANELGVKVKPMNFWEANEGRSNIYYNRGGVFKDNCQCCVVVHEMRLRGIDATSVGYDYGKESIPFRLGERFQDIWINPKTGKIPQPTILRDKTDDALYIKLDKATEVRGRYHIGINGIDNTGHMITAERLESGKLIFYDPQSGDFVNIKEYTKLGYLEVLKVDKLIFNKSMICKILQII